MTKKKINENKPICKRIKNNKIKLTVHVYSLVYNKKKKITCPRVMWGDERVMQCGCVCSQYEKRCSQYARESRIIK